MKRIHEGIFFLKGDIDIQLMLQNQRMKKWYWL